MSASESSSSRARGHLVLFLQEEPVLFAARPAVQLDADGGQDGPGLVDGHGVDVVGQDRHGQHHGGQGGHVPEPTVGLLQIGLEQEAHVPVRAVPLGDQVGQHPEPRRLLLDPPLAGAVETGSATLASPHTTRASSSPRATRRSSAAMSRTSPGGGRCGRGRSPRPRPDTRSCRPWPTRPASLVDEDDVEVAVGAQLDRARTHPRPSGPVPGRRRRWPGRRVRSATRRPPSA